MSSTKKKSGCEGQVGGRGDERPGVIYILLTLSLFVQAHLSCSLCCVRACVRVETTGALTSSPHLGSRITITPPVFLSACVCELWAERGEVGHETSNWFYN